ncbi:tripartite tricarboxylate transporter substrate binding protein [Caenimonas sedimenti]|uniref:Tripartite tricarboxylate transporter substrate binding protein n=1 Tax=Caenimonas sedimenti TaxID=2596921 RepID=A0A562ZN62_9BURK|nr:tripartite tricarboxylate transporter substrate-binding protein [Caenimonas sedimenti]TWO69745.1 tripartite tricarboxylate transporter substrate binding protein [Caenimonas sedimenti]
MNVLSGSFSRRAWLRAAAATTATASFGATWAQAFPARPFRIVVPWAAGGSVDIAGRVVGEALHAALGQPGVVENMPGAAGTIGADQVAKAVADGHTLLIGTSSMAIDVAGGRKTPYELQRDLLPVALVADTHSIVLVPPGSPYRTLADLIAAARAKPGELTYGTQGVGSPAHLFSELFCQAAQIKMLHVPYSRTRPAADLIAGRLSVMFATAPSSIGQVKGSVLRPLAVTGSRRLAALPDVPTVAQAGVPGYEAGQWVGVFAPAATPVPVVERLSQEITAAVSSAPVTRLLEDRALEPRTAASPAMRKIVAEEIDKWAAVMRTGGIKLEA